MNAGARLVLYNYWRSSASYRVRIGLGLKQLAFEYVAVNLLRRDQHGEAYRAKNPMAQVPVLEIFDHEPAAGSAGELGHGSGPAAGQAARAPIALTQSLAILEYLDERWPDPPLLPRDPYLRARARGLAELINAGIQPMQNTGTIGRIKALGVDELAWVRPAIADGLAAFARSIADTAGAFCVGDSPTLADCCLVPQLVAVRRYRVELDPVCQRLFEIEARCLALTAFANAQPDRQPDAVPPVAS
jgi:maleylpyruvate isomerase